MNRGNRKEEILEAAVKVFYEKGFNGATTSEIAKEAGISEGTIFRYFATKKDILKAVMKRFLEVIGKEFITNRISDILKQYEGQEEREILKAIIKDRLILVKKYSGLLKVVLTEAQFHEDLREEFKKNIALRGKDVLEKFIIDGQKRGVFKEINSTVVTRSIAGIFAAYVLQSCLMPGLVALPEEKQIDDMLDIMLYGIVK